MEKSFGICTIALDSSGSFQYVRKIVKEKEGKIRELNRGFLILPYEKNFCLVKSGICQSKMDVEKNKENKIPSNIF